MALDLGPRRRSHGRRFQSHRSSHSLRPNSRSPHMLDSVQEARDSPLDRKTVFPEKQLSSAFVTLTQLGLLTNSKSRLFCKGDQAEFVGIIVTSLAAAGKNDEANTPAQLDHRIVSGLSKNPILRRNRRRRIAASDTSQNQPSRQSQAALSEVVRWPAFKCARCHPSASE